VPCEQLQELQLIEQEKGRMETSVLREVATNIAGYFRDFLESDFKKMQAPSRRIVLQSDTGFRAGMRLKPYASLDQDFWRLLQQPSGGEPLTIKLIPRRYTRNLSTIIQTVISEQIASINESQVFGVREAVKAKIADSYSHAIGDPEEWIEGTLDAVCEEFSVKVVKPLISRLDGPLQRQAYSVVDSLYAAETDIVKLLVTELMGALPSVLAKHLAERDDALVDECLAAFIEVDIVRTNLQKFFQTFIAADAFLEFRDLHTYASVTDGITLYLYLGAIRFRGISYPLFFLPIEVTVLPNGAGFELTVINQLFANRAAIDYALQEVAQAKSRSWASVITDRIIYLQPKQTIFEVVNGLFAQVANAVDLAGKTTFGSASADANNPDVGISSALYLCAFEKGAEALVNDYEELIKLAKEGGGAIVNLFEGMVKGILQENPVSIRRSVDSEWDEMEMVDRLVFDSPIPLNEEQRKILMAAKKSDGKIIVVEGPPGTGKSHTITAIAADCAFNQKSCLILSDKAEALEVVHNKLSEAMSRVRHDRDFPNPLLRLGRQDANFKKLVANQTVNQVAAFSKAMSANAHHLESERTSTTEHLKQSIVSTITAAAGIELIKVKELQRLEDLVKDLDPTLLDIINRIEPGSISVGTLDSLVKMATDIEAYLGVIDPVVASDIQWLTDRVETDLTVGQFADKNTADLAALQSFERLNAQQIKDLSAILLEYEQLKMPVFGYLFRGASVRALEARLNTLPTHHPLLLKAEHKTLKKIVPLAGGLRQELERINKPDHLEAAYAQLATGRSKSAPSAATKSLLAAFSQHSDWLSRAIRVGAKNFVLILTFIQKWLALKEQFASIPDFDYVGTKDKLDRLNTSRMNAHVDSRLVQFTENNRADAKTMAQLIAKRQKFPENKFEAVRSSFPVIIAGIREFGEYMPLCPDLFDVVVIDEASQVSVAQALPAMLRAKKVVVLGDSRQFANVKSTNASNATNDKYRSALVNFFQNNVANDAETLQRLSMFDVKKSVLEFCSLTSSYTTMLRKHFRSYPELIGYSSKTFYDGQLQAIKIRGVPIEDVIRFDQVEVEGQSVTRTTNTVEANFILDKLMNLLDEDSPPTVGVITPFREQATLLTKQLFSHQHGRDFEDRLKLKVMTFDSCQGEERNLIFYSMVASPGLDALSYVFPAATEIDASAVEEKLKVQRLNVGFSRAQECVWFIHSQPLGLFKGSIAQALNHYARTLHAKLGSADQTDPSSPMEAKVLGWLQATQFVQAQPEDIEIVPQFPIGDYLKQIDPMYEHPAYQVDFLLSCRTPKGVVQIVIEYDGFEFHFKKGEDVHVGNHMRYMTDADVERQLTLESYGYRFIRINRFNVGKDPVAALDERLAKIVQTATGEQPSQFVDRLREQAQGMVSKEMRQCGRCESIKPLDGFFDQALKSGNGGYGRICMDCKNKAIKPKTTSTPGTWRRRRRWY